MWTHIARTDSAIDSQIFPRLIALSEALWSEKSKKDFDDFHRRLKAHYPLLDFWGVNYGFEAHPLTIKSVFNQEKDKMEIQLFSGVQNAEIRFTIDGSKVTQNSPLYNKPFFPEEMITIRARAFKNGMPYGAELREKFNQHLAIGEKVRLKNPFSQKYTAGGAFGLTDGRIGSVDFFKEKWQGFEGEHFEAEIEFESTTQINKISTSFLRNLHSWIFPPEHVSFAVSEDGSDFQVVESITNKISKEFDAAEILTFSTSLNNQPVKSIKITAKSIINCPEWHQGAGGKAWLFIDEIIVE
jgi:hexosaminidase